ncbi:MAG: hypothetical protein ABWZ82_00275 [Candidatus Limnocylindrales bacterium]
MSEPRPGSTSEDGADAIDDAAPAVDGLASTPPLADAQPSATPFDGGRSVRQAGMITAALGLVHALLILVSWALLATVPRIGDIAAATDFYDDVDRRRIALVGLYLMPFAVIAFIWFEVALRMWIAGTHRRANVLLSNVQLVSGMVFVTLFAASTATAGVTVAAAEWAGAPIDPATAALLPAYGDTLLFVFAIRMAAMFMFTTTSIARSADVLPRWFVALGYVLGTLLLLSATFTFWLYLVFPLWLMVLSALLFRRARAIPPDLVMPHPAPLLTPIGRRPPT